MTNIMLRCVKMCNKLSHSREVIDTVTNTSVVIAVMIASEVCVPVSCATVVRADTMIDVLTGMVFSVLTVGSADADIREVTMTDLGCMPMLTSLGELSTFGWGACSC